MSLKYITVIGKYLDTLNIILNENSNFFFPHDWTNVLCEPGVVPDEKQWDQTALSEFPGGFTLKITSQPAPAYHIYVSAKPDPPWADQHLTLLLYLQDHLSLLWLHSSAFIFQNQHP